MLLKGKGTSREKGGNLRGRILKQTPTETIKKKGGFFGDKGISKKAWTEKREEKERPRTFLQTAPV